MTERCGCCWVEEQSGGVTGGCGIKEILKKKGSYSHS